MNETCFVIMPYGKKTDIDGRQLDFDKIYNAMIRPSVESVGGLACVRCDDIEQPGWIHERMVRNIFDARVAIVDTSTLNANVFYELGIRHALRGSVTVLIHREGTSWPFNIAGLSSIGYTTTEAGMEQAAVKIATNIRNALKVPDASDSLVYHALPYLRVQRAPQRLTQVEVFGYSLKKAKDRRIAFITGDRDDIRVGDVWVSSENTNMKMDNLYGKSTSATIRYLGARKDRRGMVTEDTIADELNAQMDGLLVVNAGQVIATGPGDLARNGVKWIYHVASVTGVPRQGYQPVGELDQCVKNALRLTNDAEYDDVRSIVFPIFATGPGGGDLMTHARICIQAAIEQLEIGATPVTEAYFYAWSDVDLEACLAVADNHPGLRRAR